MKVLISVIRCYFYKDVMTFHYVSFVKHNETPLPVLVLISKMCDRLVKSLLWQCEMTQSDTQHLSTPKLGVDKWPSEIEQTVMDW